MSFVGQLAPEAAYHFLMVFVHAELVSLQGGNRYTPASPRVQMKPPPATAFSSQPGTCQIEGDVRLEAGHSSTLPLKE